MLIYVAVLACLKGKSVKSTSFIMFPHGDICDLHSGKTETSIKIIHTSKNGASWNYIPSIDRGPYSRLLFCSEREWPRPKDLASSSSISEARPGFFYAVLHYDHYNLSI